MDITIATHLRDLFPALSPRIPLRLDSSRFSFPSLRFTFRPPSPRSITSRRFFYLQEGLAARANRSNDLANEIISPGEKFETRANFFPARNSISLVARFGVPLSDPAPLNFDCIVPPR